MSSIVHRIAADLGVPKRLVDRLIASGPYRYKVYSVRKRTGGYRQIAQPTPAVKDIQNWLVGQVFSNYPISNRAVGYISGIGIRDNADAHAKHKYLLKMDFSDFFGSILKEDIESFLLDSTVSDLSDSDIEKISRVVCWKKPNGALSLCIGAPSSPVISNIIMNKFDDIIGTLSDALGVVYTRYSDDLAFSTSEPNVLGKLESEVKDVIAQIDSPNLKINEKKTIHASTASKRQVTGLILTPAGDISVGRSRKRLVRAMLDRFRRGILDRDQTKVLQGNLAFIFSIEPEFLDRMKRKYGEDVVNRAMTRTGK